jgi:hypothetical protein
MEEEEKEEEDEEEEETLTLYHIQPYCRTLMLTTMTDNISMPTMKLDFPCL